MHFPLEKNTFVNGTVRIRDDFWDPKLRTFFDVTLPDTFNKLEKDGEIENLKDVAAGCRDTHRGNPWNDGLLMETIRGASDYLRRGEKSAEIEKRIDGYTEVFEQAQKAAGGGFISSYTELDRHDQRFGENGGSILWQHDLYNSGCLFEAGVHYYLATRKTRLLCCALRSANELAALIGPPPKKWIVPGHELPSYALIELIELLEDEPGLLGTLPVKADVEGYRALVHFWIHGRGHYENRTNHPQYMGEYSQDHAPIEAQFQAVGHAVRATLYYTGVTRLAMLENDPELLKSALRIYNNIVERKLHVNGGIGATHFEEKFGEDYDLVNSAYLETCATVGLIFFAESLSRAAGDARYFDTVERGLYNLMLSSVTLQGDSYFYQNPLISDGTAHHWAWHTCPCCPPMIHKTFGMLDRLIYAEDGDGILVNLFIGGSAELHTARGKVRLVSETGLPWKGCYRLTVEEAEQELMLRLRVPFWADGPSYTLNGAPVETEIRDGYQVFRVTQGDVIGFTDPLPVRRVEAHPYVRPDQGRIALSRGPLIYCVEGVDNHGETDFTLSDTPEFRVEMRKDLLGGVAVISGKRADGELFRAVPLYAWDNRLAGSMNVWLRQKGKAVDFDTAGWQRKLYRYYEERIVK